MPKPRKSSDLVPERTMKIFCEGEKTERFYIIGYLETDLDRKKVVGVEKSKKNTPVQLVEEAIKAKESPKSLPNDEFWVVYDRESAAKYPDALHAKARQLADRNGIKVALSNVCFEYWLLIHLVDTTAPYSSYDDLHRNSPFIRAIKERFDIDYEKSSVELFNLIKDDIPQARQRGTRLNEQGRKNADRLRDKDHHNNPYMGMVHLLDAIDQFR